MSGNVGVVPLKDGSRVPIDTFNSLCAAASTLVQGKDFYTLHSLIKKCQDASFKFIAKGSSDPSSFLKQYNLIDANDDVYEDVRKIVSNLVEINGSKVGFFVPMGEGIVQVTLSGH